MPTVKFQDISQTGEVTFDVDGQVVKRSIPLGLSQADQEDSIRKMAEDLSQEFKTEEKTVAPVSFVQGQVLVSE